MSQANIRSITLLVAKNVSAHVIGPTSSQDSFLDPHNNSLEVWNGYLKLIQEEVSEVESDALVSSILSGGATPAPGSDAAGSAKSNGADLLAPEKPYNSIRLKIELFNKKDDKIVDWAEVWYNPLHKTETDYSIANNGEDSIQILSESCQNYKIVAQLPGTGYHPIDDISTKGSSPEDRKTQVALELKFNDSEDGWTFVEKLDRYHSNYASVVETYLYELRLLEAERKMRNVQLNSSKLNMKHDRAGVAHSKRDDELFDYDSDEEDDNFGDFVEA